MSFALLSSRCSRLRHDYGVARRRARAKAAAEGTRLNHSTT